MLGILPSVVMGLILGTFVLWLSAKWLRFRNPSFWASFCCMAIAIGVAVAGVLEIPRLSFMAFIGTGLAIVAVVGVITVALLFREPVWKSIFAIGLVLVSQALLLWVSIMVSFALAVYGCPSWNQIRVPCGLMR